MECKTIKTNLHLNPLAAQNTAFSNIPSWSFINLQGWKNFQISSRIMYIVGLLINQIDVNKLLPLANTACVACAVPHFWAALRQQMLLPGSFIYCIQL